MIDITGWTPFYKFSDEGHRVMSQQTYEPLINLERNIFCANYAWPNFYQCNKGNRNLYTEEIVSWFFANEVAHVIKFQKKSYMPKVEEIDYKNRRIYFQWNDYTINELFYFKKSVEWREQLQFIMTDLYDENVYKLTMYPHCHFFDKDGAMKTIDWYGCIPVHNPLIESKYMDGIIHETAVFRLKETGDLVDGKYNLEIMFKQGLLKHVLWGGNNLEYIHREIFKNV